MIPVKIDKGQSNTASGCRGGAARMIPRCRCPDLNCPACDRQCLRPAFVKLYRTDLDDETGTAFCDRCAAAALESGIFTYEYKTKDKTRYTPRDDSEDSVGLPRLRSSFPLDMANPKELQEAADAIREVRRLPAVQRHTELEDLLQRAEEWARREYLNVEGHQE